MTLIIDQGRRIFGLREKPRWRSSGPIVEGRVPLKGYDRLIIPERSRWRGAVLKRRDFMIAAGLLSFAARTHRARSLGLPLGGSVQSGFLLPGHWMPANFPLTPVYPLGTSSFTGSMSGGILTASGVSGTIQIGQVLQNGGLNIGVVTGSAVTNSSLTGMGGAGTYSVSNTGTVASEAMTGGTNAWARHLKAYYDGENAIPMILPMTAWGGALPIVWGIEEAPAGSAIGMIYSALGVNYGGYGDLVWYPQESISGADFVITGTGQDQATLPFAWATSTSSSTSDFLFASASRGVDTNSGTYGSPLLTLEEIYGNYTGAPGSTFPGTRLYLIDGTFELYNESNPNAGAGMVISGAANPATIMALPGASISLDITNDTGSENSSGSGIVLWSGTSDVFLQGFSFVNTPSTQQTNFRYIYDGYGNHRLTFHNITALNVFAGTAPSGNASLIDLDNPGATAPLRQCIAAKGLYETNRTSGTGSNSFAVHDYYCTGLGVTEFCTATGVIEVSGHATFGIFLKDSNQNHTIRYCYVAGLSPGAQFGIGTGNQFSSGAPQSQNIEICYNLIMNAGGNDAIENNYLEFACGVHYNYRNSMIGYGDARDVSGNGPFNFWNCAIQYGSAAQAIMVNNTAGTLPTNVTNTGPGGGAPVCQASSGIFDANGNLTGIYASYAGIVGAQIQ